MQIDEMVIIISDLQRAVNALCRLSGREEIYPPTDGQLPGGEPVTTWAADEFFGHPVTTSITKVLERASKPMSYEDIRAALEEGGCNELGKVQSTLSKATHTFRKLPNGLWGLAKWYKERAGIIRRNREPNEVTEPGDELLPGATE